MCSELRLVFRCLSSTAAAVTAWDMYDSLNASDREEAEPSSDAETSKCPDSAVDGSRGVDRSVSMVSMASTGNDHRPWT